ncbi:MAG: hypothetical protein KC432_01680, partial [Thermomicrobiales bacterium]|nr:hypothetical protein [Thermomicrobiales bacterium]
MSSARPPATASRAPRQSPLLGGYFALLVILLYLPICILVLFSLNQNTVLIFPLEGFTLDWYQKALDTPAAIDAARNSLVVALGSSVVATILATMLAILITRYSFRGKQVLLAAASLPLIVPYIVLAVALLILFSLLGVDRSLLTVAAAHSVVALPYALLIIVSRLTGLSPFLDEASADL